MGTAPAKGEPTVEDYLAVSRHSFWDAYYSSGQGVYLFSLRAPEVPAACLSERYDAQKKLFPHESREKGMFIFLPPTKVPHINVVATEPWLQCYKQALGREASVNILDLETHSHWIVTQPVVQVSKRRHILKYTSGIPALHWGGVALAVFLVVVGLSGGPTMLVVAGLGLAATVAASLWEINRSK